MPDAPSTTASETRPKAAKPSKGPSRFFTEYYAAAFLFLVTAFIGAAFVVLWPSLSQIKETNAQTESQLALIAQERSYVDSLDQSIAAVQSIPAASLEQVSKALPADPQVPSLLVQFGSAADRNRIQIGSIDFSQPVTAAQKSGSATNVVPMDINLTLQARSYFDVKRFLTDIESSLRLLDVVGISASQSATQVTYSLQLRTYTFPTRAVKPSV